MVLMSTTITAQDLWLLVRKLPKDEQVHLARLVLRAASASGASDSAAYRSTPPKIDELTADDEMLAWEGDGWEEFSASR